MRPDVGQTHFFFLLRLFKTSEQTQSSRANMGPAGSVIMNMMWPTSPSAQFLLTVSMSLRFSTSCLLSLISLDATHVLIWSRRRWGTRRRRRRRGRGTERRRQREIERERGRDADTLVNTCRDSSSTVMDGELGVCTRQTGLAWILVLMVTEMMHALPLADHGDI